MRMISCSVFMTLCLFLQVTTAKRFAFVQDDFEDTFESNWQVSLLNWFLDHGYSVSAGIIADRFTGTDTAVYDALKRCVNLPPEKCSLFNHGQDAIFRYSDTTSVQDAYSRISEAHNRIVSFFPGYNLNAFIPNANYWNQYTIDAVRQMNYAAISCSTRSYSNMAWDLTANPMQVPQQSETGVYHENNQTWTGYPIQSVINECVAAGNRGEDCVILVHPHEFASGAYTFDMLQQLINGLNAAGFTESVNLATIVREQQLKQGKTDAPTRSPTAIPTRTRTANPTVTSSVSPTVTATGSTNSGGSNNNNDPSWLDQLLALAPYYLAAIAFGIFLFLVLIALAVRYFYLRMTRDEFQKGGDLASESESSDESIEMGLGDVEEKSLPNSVRRSRMDMEETGSAVRTPSMTQDRVSVSNISNVAVDTQGVVYDLFQTIDLEANNDRQIYRDTLEDNQVAAV